MAEACPKPSAAQDNTNPVPPFQIFDNLILIDSLCPDQADHVIDAVRHVGFDPQ